MSVEGFNYDNIFIRLLNRLGDAVILSVAFVIFSIPIFTIGASITAVYYTAMRGLKYEDGYVWKNFVKSFKQNFKQSTLIWLICVGVLAVLGVDVWFWIFQWKELGVKIAQPMIAVSVIMLSLAVMITIYVFPLQAKFDNKIKIQFRNAFLLSIKYFPTTLMIVAILLVVAWMFYYQPLLAVFGFLIAGFGILGYVCGYFMLNCFKPYLPEDKPIADDEFSVEDEAEEEEQEEEASETEEDEKPEEKTQETDVEKTQEDSSEEDEESEEESE